MSMHIDFASPTEPSEEDVDGITELSAEDFDCRAYKGARTCRLNGNTVWAAAR